DKPALMRKQIETLRATIEAGITRAELPGLLAQGGARNALDCALWDLQAKRCGKPVWQLAGMPEPRPLTTTYTLSADAPQAVAESARRYPDARALKLKLANDAHNAERLRALRSVCPQTWLMVDANQGLTRKSLAQLAPTLVEANVAVLEQPFPVGREAWLDEVDCPVPLAADESVQGEADLPGLAGRVQVINIKLDKCGGLTAGLALARKARDLGFQVMVGNMGGSSWSMAPAFVIGSLCTVVDLDGPIVIRRDREPGACYRDGQVWCPDTIWGGPHMVAA